MVSNFLHFRLLNSRLHSAVSHLKVNPFSAFCTKRCRRQRRCSCAGSTYRHRMYSERHTNWSWRKTKKWKKLCVSNYIKLVCTEFWLKEHTARHTVSNTKQSAYASQRTRSFFLHFSLLLMLPLSRVSFYMLCVVKQSHWNVAACRSCGTRSLNRVTDILHDLQNWRDVEA